MKILKKYGGCVKNVLLKNPMKQKCQYLQQSPYMYVEFKSFKPQPQNQLWGP